MTTIALREDVAALGILARRLCGNAADADDLVQDTFERAFRAGHRYEDRGNRRGWLATILRNRFIDRCRHKRTFELAAVELDHIPAQEPTARPAWESITTAQVAAALDQIGESFRRVYELHAAGHSYHAIARELGISTNTVGTRLFRARAKLEAILKVAQAPTHSGVQ
jgi:RNA polymerase sigma-70 factor (ECF subfamily)